MTALFPDFSVSISQKRNTAVLDPRLALSPWGILLVKYLADYLDLWVPRSFWHMLDNSHFYLCRPEAAADDFRFGQSSEWLNQEAIGQALQEWEKLRAVNHPGKLKIYYIADGPSESIMPAHFEVSLISRFETLSSNLDKRLQSENLLSWAFRDAIALSAALPSAFILTQVKINEGGSNPPPICKALQEWGLDFDQIHDDEWLPIEREYFRQKMVLAGMSKLRWAGLRLAVLHMVAPAAALLNHGSDNSLAACDPEYIEMEELNGSACDFDYWQGAKGFWYPL